MFISIISVILFISNHIYQHATYELKEIIIPYSDDIVDRHIHTTRGGNRRSAMGFGYQGNYYEPTFYVQDDAIELPNEYQQGDYLKNIRLVYLVNKCIDIYDGASLCKKSYIASGEYYANKYGKSYQFVMSEFNENWWRGATFYFWHVVIILAWVTILMWAFITRNQERGKLFNQKTGKPIDPERLQIYDVEIKAKRDARRQAVKEAWQAKKWW